MTAKVGVSRDGLHLLLWMRRQSNGTIRVNQERLATELTVSKFAINRILQRMVAEGRLKKHPGAAHRPVLYTVIDPDEWANAMGANS